MAGNTQEKLYKMVLMQYGIQPDEDTGEQQLVKHQSMTARMSLTKWTLTSTQTFF